MPIDVGLTGAFFGKFMAALEHALARPRTHGFELKLCDPVWTTEFVVYPLTPVDGEMTRQPQSSYCTMASNRVEACQLAR